MYAVIGVSDEGVYWPCANEVDIDFTLEDRLPDVRLVSLEEAESLAKELAKGHPQYKYVVIQLGDENATIH